MALKKDCGNIYSATAPGEYWNIQGVTIDKRGKLVVSLNCYEDLSSRQAEKLPIGNKVLEIDINNTELKDSLFSSVYTMLKLINDFIGAEDI